MSHGFATTFKPQQQQQAPIPAAGSLGGFPVPVWGGAAGGGPETVGRLVIESLGGPHWWPEGEAGPTASGDGDGDDEDRQERKVVAFVRQLRQMLQDSRCSAMVTCPAGVDWGRVEGVIYTHSHKGPSSVTDPSLTSLATRPVATIGLHAAAARRRRRLCSEDAQRRLGGLCPTPGCLEVGRLGGLCPASSKVQTSRLSLLHPSTTGMDRHTSETIDRITKSNCLV